jgi:hypothetical protein
MRRAAFTREFIQGIVDGIRLTKLNDDAVSRHVVSLLWMSNIGGALPQDHCGDGYVRAGAAVVLTRLRRELLERDRRRKPPLGRR